MASRLITILAMFFAAVWLVGALPLTDNFMNDLYTRSSGDHVQLFARATWGSGKYTVDLDVYHRDLKPKILAEFRQMGSFTSLCGQNPDFMIERDGTVYPSATGAQRKTGKCTKSKFSKNLGDLVATYVAVSSGSESDGGGHSKGKPKGKPRGKR